MALKTFYSANDFAAGLPATKNFDVHHSKDTVWLCVINKSEFYFDFLYDTGLFAGSVGKFERVCFKLRPRPMFIEVVPNGNGTALAGAVAMPKTLLLGIDEEFLFEASDIPVG